MIQELAIAGQLLSGALDRYLKACTTVQVCFAQGNQLESVLYTLQDRLDDELKGLNAFENKLKQAKAAISSSRNYHTSLVPVNSLPSELLTRIFRLLLETRPCTRHERVVFPRYPDLLTHVCSRWRRVALSSRALWSHIDLAPCISLHHGMLARAMVCATRAGNLPLDVHVMTLGDLDAYEEDIQDGIEQFLTSINTRTRSLEFLAWGMDNHSAHIPIFKSSLKHCMPGVLTQLVVKNSFWVTPTFLQSEEISGLPGDPGWPGGILMDGSYEPIEELWQHITSLRLSGLYPCWTSAAYHGLTELCLDFGPNPDETISEAHLVAILESCPELRVFRFDSAAFGAAPLDDDITSVYLDQLEVLDIVVREEHEAACLLRWIAPGSKPLSVSFTGEGQMHRYLAYPDVKLFFARSNIAKVRFAGSVVSYSGVARLFNLTPDLEVLVLDHTRWFTDDGVANFYGTTLCGVSAEQFWLDRLDIVQCSINYIGFKKFLERNLVQTITIRGCDFDLSSSPSRIAGLAKSDLLAELFAYCAASEIIYET